MIIDRKRRPYVHTVITNDYEPLKLTPEYEALYTQLNLSRGPSSGVELTLMRQGLRVDGFYDHGVGLGSLVIPWVVLDAERAKL